MVVTSVIGTTTTPDHPMNIFVTDADPNKSASCLPDKHIVKMPLETCQMLSIVGSAKWGHNFGTLPKLDGTPYQTEKGAFRNHPCTIWAQTNFRWLIDHGLALCAEYTHRYGKTHSCQHTIEHADKIYIQSSKSTRNISNKLQTTLVNSLKTNRKALTSFDFNKSKNISFS